MQRFLRDSDCEMSSEREPARCLNRQQTATVVKHASLLEVWPVPLLSLLLNTVVNHALNYLLRRPLLDPCMDAIVGIVKSKLGV